ncbi:7512_t:CDS:2 [Funneliformis mosseae]|uniref:7512_t:CDS:1 n=1 Tax=Funneliformis mosseae TaxID=27381 RepID=A0A9N9C1G1_FUNMO|nr:7512_t:CDS:2 [Funneliformis mosseae]
MSVGYKFKDVYNVDSSHQLGFIFIKTGLHLRQQRGLIVVILLPQACAVLPRFVAETFAALKLPNAIPEFVHWKHWNKVTFNSMS